MTEMREIKCRLEVINSKCRANCWKYEDDKCCKYCNVSDVCEKPCDLVSRFVRKNKKGNK